jgi:hypothetical protein
MSKEPEEVHHIIPQSRDGSDHDSNLVAIPEKFHRFWHGIFQNLKPSEQVEFVRQFNKLAESRDELDGRDLHDLRQIIKNKDRQWEDI